MIKIKSAITKVHFYLLGFIILNLLVKSFVEIGLNYRITFYIKIIIYLTGAVLFFLNLKPIKIVVIYFLYYILTPLVVALFWKFHGILLAVLSSIFLLPIYPNEIRYEKDNWKIYDKFQGFFSACCMYEIKEQKYFLLEKNIGELHYQVAINSNNIELKAEKDSIKIKLKDNCCDFDKNQEFKYDTIVMFKIK